MSSARRNWVLRHPVVVDVGCNCRRPKLLLSSLLSSFSSSSSSCRGAYKQSSTSTNSSTSSATMTTTATATATNSSSWEPPSFTTNFNNSPYSYEDQEYHRPMLMVSSSTPAPPPLVSEEEEATTRRRRRRSRRSRGRKQRAGSRVARESVAVAVESEEPYEDFRESMVQMVVEKEMYAWEDLNGLLHRFLTLNSPRHHPLILRAFADLWSGLFAPPSPLQYSRPDLPTTTSTVFHPPPPPSYHY